MPDVHRGRAQGVFQMLTSGSLLLAGVWAGALWEAGPGRGELPLIISGVVAAVAMVAMVVGRRWLPSTLPSATAAVPPAPPVDDVPRA